jgi:regulator of sigma E protease
MSIVWSIVGFAILIGVLVTIHEWGHFAVARWFNVKVVQFSVGFGRPIYKVQRGETEYRLGLFPLGGYVKFLDERVEPVEEADKPRAFNNQSVYKRFAIVLAGPMVNLVFAWLLFAFINLIGVTSLKPIFEQPKPGTALAQTLGSVESNHQAWLLEAINSKPVASWQDVQQAVLNGLVHDQSSIELDVRSVDHFSQNYTLVLPLSGLDINKVETPWLSELGFMPSRPTILPIIGEVQNGSPADMAGLRSGDRILSMGGQPMASWLDLVEFVRAHPAETVDIRFERNSAEFVVTATLEGVEQQGKIQGRLGAAVDQNQELDARFYSVNRSGLFESLSKGWDQMLSMVSMTLTMFKKMLFGEVGLAHLSGPISIADFSGQALQSGFVSFISLMALISLSLGILNLLPIPMLDGGHLMYYLYEMVSGKPVSERFEEAGFRVGLFIIISLSLLAIGNDLLRLTHG